VNAVARIYSGITDLKNRRQTVYASPRLIVTFEMDRTGIRKIAVGEALKAAVHSAVVQRAMPFAIQISPHGDTLEYVSSWRAVDGFTVIAGMRRAACNLLNTSGHAAAVEWGRGGNQRILGRTLAHLNGTSPIGLEQAARKAARSPFNPQLHPRGPSGRYRHITADEIRTRAQRAAQLRNNRP
jgi:hypothetical protein